MSAGHPILLMPPLHAPTPEEYRTPRPADARSRLARPGQAVRLLYVSRPVERLAPFEVMQIIATSRRQNWRAGLTGCLLFTGSEFAQVLEGPLATVQALFERLSNDPRHTDVRIAWRGAADSRRFPNWTMGYLLDTDLASDVAAMLAASTVPEGSASRLIARMADDVFLGTS
jgi:hypothetical protein